MRSEKIIAAGLLAAALTGCSTTDHRSVEDWQGKVWRGLVSKTMVDTTGFQTKDQEWISAVKYDARRDVGLRMARVHFASGWDSVIANAIVPDNIEFADIPKGTLVDIMAEFGPDTDHSVQRFTRIIRLVCAAKDKECLAREKAAKRIGSVIENLPNDVNSRYGVTYFRRASKEDVKKYD